MKSDITAVIPTYNEETNIKECIISLSELVKKIIIMDYFSTDNTKEIAENLGVIVYQSYDSYKERVNKGINLDEIKTKWILNIDADERITTQSAKEISKLCLKYSESESINGIVLRYQSYFMGKMLTHGFKPYKMRLFKKGKAYLENKELDEHFLLKEGKTVRCKSCLEHHDFKGMNPLITKWNNFAERAANEIMAYQDNNVEIETKGLATISKIRRFVKYSIYLRLPISIRSHLHFIYYYYVKLGFLDGEKGKIYLFMLAYWYRYLTDVYIMEKKYFSSKKKTKQ